MAKQELVWVTNDGDIFGTKEEAEEDEARQVLKGAFRMTDGEIETLCFMIDDKELAAAVNVYARARVAAQKMREEKHAGN